MKQENEEHVHGPDCDHDHGHGEIEKVAAKFADENFPKLWEHSKKEIKELSKKDIAQQMFFTGAAMILEALQHQQHDEEREDKE
tara:strand:- start:303 stop:554 length:252 start_codon:yes stop_codon:yes gene_type:complete